MTPRKIDIVSAATRRIIATVVGREKKCAAVVVISEELLRANSAVAEAVIGNDLVRACAEAIDRKFLSDEAISDASPPAILSGISAISGNSDIAYSLRALLESLGGSLERAVFVARAATYASMMSANFPRIGIPDGVC